MMLVLSLGLKAKFCGLGLAIGWPWPKIQGQNLGGLQCSPWTSIDSSELYFKIHVPYLLNVPTLVILLRIMSVMSDVIKLRLYPCKSTLKTGFHCFIFHRKPLHWDGHGLGLVLECFGLVNITAKKYLHFILTHIRSRLLSYLMDGGSEHFTFITNICVIIIIVIFFQSSAPQANQLFF